MTSEKESTYCQMF